MPESPKDQPLPILLVDDEEIVLMALRDTLIFAGYDVITSPHPSHAISIVKQKKFAVVIADQQMPLVSGLEFLSEVKKLQPNATRILITAVLTLDTVIDAINKGEIYRFIVKPWLREELLATLRNAVQRFELISNNLRAQAETEAANAKLSESNNQLQAQLAAATDRNARLQSLLDAQKENFRQALNLSLEAVEAHCPGAAERARKTHALCLTMAKLAKLSDEETETLETSALLYDVGLTAVPPAIFKRWHESPQNLTAAEWTTVRQHPVVGQTLAAFAHDLKDVGAAIRAHHERFDGGGYPDGLKGEGIPQLARLLGAAVAYTHSPRNSEESAQMLRHGAGTEFDPDAVALLLRTLPKAAKPTGQREVRLSELTPGMILAQGVFTDSGALLIPDGERLTSTYIDQLLNYSREHPIAQSLQIYC